MLKLDQIKHLPAEKLSYQWLNDVLKVHKKKTYFHEMAKLIYLVVICLITEVVQVGIK